MKDQYYISVVGGDLGVLMMDVHITFEWKSTSKKCFVALVITLLPGVVNLSRIFVIVLSTI